MVLPPLSQSRGMLLDPQDALASRRNSSIDPSSIDAQDMQKRRASASSQGSLLQLRANDSRKASLRSGSVASADTLAPPPADSGIRQRGSSRDTVKSSSSLSLQRGREGSASRSRQGSQRSINSRCTSPRSQGSKEQSTEDEQSASGGNASSGKGSEQGEASASGSESPESRASSPVTSEPNSDGQDPGEPKLGKLRSLIAIQVPPPSSESADNNRGSIVVVNGEQIRGRSVIAVKTPNTNPSEIRHEIPSFVNYNLQSRGDRKDSDTLGELRTAKAQNTQRDKRDHDKPPHMVKFHDDDHRHKNLATRITRLRERYGLSQDCVFNVRRGVESSMAVDVMDILARNAYHTRMMYKALPMEKRFQLRPRRATILFDDPGKRSAAVSAPADSMMPGADLGVDYGADAFESARAHAQHRWIFALQYTSKLVRATSLFRHMLPPHKMRHIEALESIEMETQGLTYMLKAHQSKADFVFSARILRMNDSEYIASRLAALQKIPHFQNVHPSILERMAQISQLHTFKARETIIKEGVENYLLYWIITGSCRAIKLVPFVKRRTTPACAVHSARYTVVPYVNTASLQKGDEVSQQLLNIRELVAGDHFPDMAAVINPDRFNKIELMSRLSSDNPNRLDARSYISIVTNTKVHAISMTRVDYARLATNDMILKTIADRSLLNIPVKELQASVLQKMCWDLHKKRYVESLSVSNRVNLLKGCVMVRYSVASATEYLKSSAKAFSTSSRKRLTDADVTPATLPALLYASHISAELRRLTAPTSTIDAKVRACAELAHLFYHGSFEQVHCEMPKALDVFFQILRGTTEQVAVRLQVLETFSILCRSSPELQLAILERGGIDLLMKLIIEGQDDVVSMHVVIPE
ncbi:hypothetical protein HDU96_007515 [Phlyctochytrium bullatum]|nr:hypothetical protein HDU96_007515 [Phlyctochytrium bullatum]